jgi:putative endonuclease
MARRGYVYIMTNRKEGTLYVGVTNNLVRRVTEHRRGDGSRFVRKYWLRRLVYVEAYDDIEEAIAREKRIKRWRRAWKLELIASLNPNWRDLYDDICADPVAWS